MYDKEEIYEKEVKELMDKVVDICIENNIQMFSTFFVRQPLKEGQGMVYYTSYNNEEKEGVINSFVEQYLEFNKKEFL